MAQVGEIIPGSDPLAIAESLHPDLTVVGPEGPLAEGIVDRFRARGFAIMGPTQEMAQLEASKIYSKNFMQRLGIPTARFVKTSSAAEAISALDQFKYPIVIKADGLAAGKGVVIATDRAQAEEAVRALGPMLVIEEFLEGEEVSFIAICDGRDAIAFEATQDHKAVWRWRHRSEHRRHGRVLRWAYLAAAVRSAFWIGSSRPQFTRPASRASFTPV